ncbi:MAG: hypothetical protein LUM44_17595 [Pyrinomonadaceae bacterium]|nr:hypothetical protein [Pyrinomonadaceae bacterium]
MKIISTCLFFLLFSQVCYSQTCNIPSLRGLKLGMTAQAVDSLFAVEDDTIYFDDAQYQLSFTRNKLIKISVDYLQPKWSDIRQFTEAYSAELGLPNDWQSVQDVSRLKQLEKKRAELIAKYTPEYFQVQQIDREIEVLKSNSFTVLKCPTFTVSAKLNKQDEAQVILRLTNRVNSKSGKFKP